jgi:hypothetical protein
VIEIDRRLKSALVKKTFDSRTIQDIQTELDRVSQDYSHDELGQNSYKLYELQAYLHVLRKEFNKALDFIEEAVRLRGHNYLDADRLLSYIKSRANKREKLVAQNVKQNAKRHIAIGAGWIVFGIIATAVSYAIARHSAEQQATLAQHPYRLSYLAMTGALIIGGFNVLRGFFKLAGSKKKTRQILASLDS